MSESNLKCPLCFNRENFKKVELGYSCPFCGLFNIDNESEDLLLNCPDVIDDEWRLKIRYKVKKHFLEKPRKPNVRQLPYVIRKDKLEEINNALSVPNLLDKIDLFLDYLRENTTFISEELTIDPNDMFPLFFCKNNYELEQIILHLVNKDFIKIKSSYGDEHKRVFQGCIDDFNERDFKYNYYPLQITRTDISSIKDYVDVYKKKIYILLLTEKGLSYLSEKRKNNLNSRQCFVAMWFNEQEDKSKYWFNMNKIYNDVIKPAIEQENKYTSCRIDCIEHCDDINDKMISEIRKSRFLLVDLTGYRGGVYWEAGFAEGLGLPVIYTCNKNWQYSNKDLHIQGVHFDLSHRNIIFLEEDKLDDFKEKIKNRIDAVIF